MEQIIRFTRGAPPAEALPVEEVALCATAALEHYGASLLNYYPAQGLEPLRAYLAAEAGITAAEIVISNGSLQMMHFVARLLVPNPGDRVLVEAPSYDRAVLAFKQAGADVRGIPLEHDGLDIERLESELDGSAVRFLYLIPDFQNPAGVTMSLAKRQRVAELAQRHGFWILEDGPYRLLRYRGTELPTLRELAPECTLHLSSLSKLLSPGMRVGWAIGPAPLVQQLARLAEDTYVSPSMLSQGVAYEYLRSGRLGPNIARLKALYAPRLDAMVAAIERHLPSATFARPEGGFFIGVHLSTGPTMSALLARASAAGVVLTDGRGFFADGQGDHFLRLPFCNLTTSEIDEGLARLGTILN